MNDIFRDARLKVQRANHQIGQIITHANNLPRTLWKFEYGEIHGFPGDGWVVFTDASYAPQQPIPEFFADFAGTATYKLRSALNNSIITVVKELDPSIDTSRRGIDMPFARDRDDLNSRASYRFIRDTFPDFAALIADEIQPYSTGNKLLWSIAKSQNTDKYDGFIPTVTLSTTGVDCRYVNGDPFMTNCSVGGDASQNVCLIPGGPFMLQDNAKTTVKVRFAPDSFFGDEPVIETLINGSKIVSETVDALERFVSA